MKEDIAKLWIQCQERVCWYFLAGWLVLSGEKYWDKKSSRSCSEEAAGQIDFLSGSRSGSGVGRRQQSLQPGSISLLWCKWPELSPQGRSDQTENKLVFFKIWMFYFCASYLVILLSFYCLLRPEGKGAKGALLGQVVLDFPSNLDFPIWTRIWIFQVHASKLIQCHTNLVKPAILFFHPNRSLCNFLFLVVSSLVRALRAQIRRSSLWSQIDRIPMDVAPWWDWSPVGWGRASGAKEWNRCGVTTPCGL